MENFKKLVRENKKIVALILATLLTIGGVKLAPETTDKLVDAVVEACCSEEPAPAPVAPNE